MTDGERDASCNQEAMSDEEIAARFAEAAARPLQVYPLQVMPAVHPAPDEVRALLREYAVIVQPGEVLVIRVPYDTPREEAEGYQRALDAAREAWGFRAIVVTAEEFGVIPEAGDEAFDRRVMAAINRLDVRADVRGGAGVPVRAELGTAWVREETLPNPPAFIAKGCGHEPADT